MKKLIALFLVAIFLTVPVLAGFEIDANNPGEGGPGVKFTINAYANKPVLDGKIDDNSYTKIAYTPADISYAWNDDNFEAKARGLDFDIYATYDDKNLYVLVRTDAKLYFNECDDGDGNCWQYSAIQVSVCGEKDEGGDRLEYGIFRRHTDGGLGGVVWSQHGGAKAEFEPTAGANYTVVLDGGNLYYETIIPANTFLNKDTMAEGDIIGFNIVMVQRDEANDSGYIHTQYSSGCTGNGKTAENFARLTLGPKMAAAAPPAAALPAPVGAKLQGELIGAVGGWGDNPETGRTAAFDGNLATFFDPAEKGNPEFYCGIKVSEPYVLSEIRIHPRTDFLDRFNGASIYGFNDGAFNLDTATLIWQSGGAAGALEWQIIPASQFIVQNVGFTSYAYFNTTEHGDVAEIELYGSPAGGTGGGDVPAPAAPSTPAPSTPPDTGDTLAIFAVMMILAGAVVAGKKVFVK